MTLFLNDYQTRLYSAELGVNRTDYANGFVLYTMHIPRKRQAIVRTRTKVGFAYETDAEDGILHIKEHLPEMDDRRARVLARRGGKGNAVTDKHITDMTTRCKPDTVPLVVRLDYRSVYDFERYLGDVLEKEKTAICLETDMHNDNVDTWFQEHVMIPQIFKGTPFEKAGSNRTSYLSLGADQIRAYHNRWWVPNNMAMSVVGYIPDESRVIQTVGDTFGRMTPKELLEPRFDIPLTHKGMVEIERGLHRLNFGIGWRVPYDSENALRLELLDCILSGSEIGILHDIRLQTGLTYDLESYYSTYGHIGSFHIATGVEPAKYQEVLGRIMEKLDGVRRNVRPSLLRNAKAYLLRELDEQLDDSERMSEEILDHHFFPTSTYVPRELEARFESIKPSDVVETAQRFLDRDNFVLVSARPTVEKQAA